MARLFVEWSLKGNAAKPTKHKIEGAMEKGIIAAAGALVVVPLSIWFYTSDHQLKYDLAEAATTLKSAVGNFFPSQPKCDSAEAVATIKRMALEEITAFRGLNSRSLTWPAHFKWGELAPENLMMGSFRKRGESGTAGSSCAAQISIQNAGKPAPDISVEYLIEPTTDGKTIVSARFQSTY